MVCQLFHLYLLIFMLLDIYYLLSIEVTPKFTHAQRNKMQGREAIKCLSDYVNPGLEQIPYPKCTALLPGQCDVDCIAGRLL